MIENLVHIVCPECSTSFEIEADQLGSEGRYVACSQCDHQWFQAPVLDPIPPTQVLSDIESVPEGLEDKSSMDSIPPLDHLDEEEIFEEKASFFTSQLFLVPVLLSLIFTGLFFARNEIVRFIPSMARFYSTLGIPAYNMNAFKFHDTQWQLINNGNQYMIEVTGRVTNTSDKLLPPPSIQVTLRGQGICQALSWTDQLFNSSQGDSKSCIISRWITQLKEGRLFSGQTCFFKTTQSLRTDQMPIEVLLKFINNPQ
ncbi:MAG: MJ0042-type zinc finger domain-containing protein [Alphaproteobacteria bacterium]